MVYGRLLQYLVPDRCPGCGDLSPSGFCLGCRNELPRIERPCGRCGLSLPAAACPRREAVWVVGSTLAPWRYAEPLQGHIQALKFAGARRLGHALGELLARHARETLGARPVDALVAVPLHRRRFLGRGYNQAIEIARAVATALRLRLLVAGITRRRATSAQAQLAARQRHVNLKRAFIVSRDLAGLDIAIIDDVITTGATVNALALELMRAGASSVHAWAVARSL